MDTLFHVLVQNSSDAIVMLNAEGGILFASESSARLLGYTHHPEAELRDDYRRLTRRARRVVERVFYGQS